MGVVVVVLVVVVVAVVVVGIGLGVVEIRLIAPLGIVFPVRTELD